MNPKFWQQNPDVVATQLLGKTVIAGTISADILSAQGYGRKENESGLYKPILTMQPGQLYCPRQRNSILVLISTFDRGRPGGCILLRAIEKDSQICEGPGRVSECLGIVHPRTTGSADWVDDDTLWLKLDTGLYPLAQKPKAKKGKRESAGGVTDAELKRLMPQIAARYMETKPPARFQDYLNELLLKCKSATELRKQIFRD